ncbi:hypothetical protein [Teredinibacter turnerae]|uniref:hypothetical protein n=1 Tax=Teredinibacter turnerae TaxID=2426 RepID=UPI0005F7A34E|nr:hypothetical protein [Teredinibacter turnerae]
MRKRRPTIRIDKWLVALNLEDTKRVQRDVEAPAYMCECELCALWKSNYKTVLPRDYLHQLARACIDLDYPTELYESSNDINHLYVRIQFHIVGELLEGPISYSRNEVGRNMYYSEVQKSPWVSVALTNHSEAYDYHPEYKDSISGKIILVDMRLALPNMAKNA